MTQDEFLAALEKTPRRWKLNINGRLRMGSHCPISAITGRACDMRSPVKAATRKLGMDGGLAVAVVDAADNTGLGLLHPRLRWRMLEACGLKP